MKDEILRQNKRNKKKHICEIIICISVRKQMGENTLGNAVEVDTKYFSCVDF